MQVFAKDYVDGGLHGTASLDLADPAGAKLVICINPMVPLNATRALIRKSTTSCNTACKPSSTRPYARGPFQPALSHQNLQAKYPDVDIILIQPEWNDYRMFSYNPMYYGSRLLAEHGFATVTMVFCSAMTITTRS